MNIEELEQRNKELHILNSIAKHLNEELSLGKALDIVLKKVVELFQLNTGWIWLLSPDPKKTYLASSYNLPPILQNQRELLEGSCWCIQKYLEDNLDTATNISEIICSRLKGVKNGTDGLKYHASVPLYSRDKKIGILNVVSAKTQKLSKQQLELLQTIGGMLSVAIERGRLFEDSKKTGIIEERNRMAREIHDTVAQGLTGISLNLETAQLLLGENPNQKIKNILNKTLELTQTNLENVRRSVLDLRAAPLLEHNLIEATDKLIKNTFPEEKYRTVFNIKGKRVPLSIRIESGLYRIIEESFNNIIHHAQASKINCDFIFEETSISIKIQDNGIGFDVDAIQNNRFGILGMSERVKLLDGIFEINSLPKEGTLIHIKIPINE